MHGLGYTQPVKQPPPTALLVFLRVLFVGLAILSFGFLTWVVQLRLAIVTRRVADWVLLGVVLVAETLAVVLIGSEPGDEIHTPGGWFGLALLLGTLVADIAYYLAADVRHFHQLRYGGYAAQPAPATAYGFPQPTPTPTPMPYHATTAPRTPPATTVPVAQNPHTPPPVPGPPIPSPPPHRPGPAPARIDQVRAELDELSDYLRQQDGGHEGGR
ncbi:hypothetical protein [Streptomyces sp. NPDC006997]|uniref:hypothetical protein n=1 Tax=Streptomyces sp. NPDC006997 TaxID=3155356 RepID=UPI0033D6A890